MACMSVFNRQPMVHAEILFIKGDNKYNHWRDDASCGSCVSERVTISPDKLCEAMRGVIVTYTVMDADTYYIIVTRQHHSDDVSFRAVIDMQVRGAKGAGEGRGKGWMGERGCFCVREFVRVSARARARACVCVKVPKWGTLSASLAFYHAILK